MHYNLGRTACKKFKVKMKKKYHFSKVSLLYIFSETTLQMVTEKSLKSLFAQPNLEPVMMSYMKYSK